MGHADQTVTACGDLEHIGGRTTRPLVQATYAYQPLLREMARKRNACGPLRGPGLETGIWCWCSCMSFSVISRGRCLPS